MSSVRNELALANAQELINVRGLFFPIPAHHSYNARELTQKTNDKCFAKCVTKPSTSLSGSRRGADAFCTFLGMKIPFRLKPLLPFFFLLGLLRVFLSVFS